MHKYRLFIGYLQISFTYDGKPESQPSMTWMGYIDDDHSHENIATFGTKMQNDIFFSSFLMLFFS